MGKQASSGWAYRPSAGPGPVSLSFQLRFPSFLNLPTPHLPREAGSLGEKNPTGLVALVSVYWKWKTNTAAVPPT